MGNTISFQQEGHYQSLSLQACPQALKALICIALPMLYIQPVCIFVIVLLDRVGHSKVLVTNSRKRHIYYTDKMEMVTVNLFKLSCNSIHLNYNVKSGTLVRLS